MSAAARLSAMDAEEACAALTRCCGASRWVDAMLQRRPFADEAAMMAAADATWAAMDEADHLEAFTHHPEIGSDLDALRARFAATAGWSSSEQASVTAASEHTLIALRDGNAEYRARFGFIFIVCATGKSAEAMLALLRARLPNARATEIANAAAEQGKITRLRLARL